MVDCGRDGTSEDRRLVLEKDGAELHFRLCAFHFVASRFSSMALFVLYFFADKSFHSFSVEFIYLFFASFAVFVEYHHLRVARQNLQGPCDLALEVCHFPFFLPVFHPTPSPSTLGRLFQPRRMRFLNPRLFDFLCSRPCFRIFQTAIHSSRKAPLASLDMRMWT